MKQNIVLTVLPNDAARVRIGLLLAVAMLFTHHNAKAQVSLGTASNFEVLAGSTITSTGETVINGGDVGLSPGTSITGFPPGIISAPYTMEAANGLAAQAESDLVTAYNTAAGLSPTANLTGQDLGGLTLTPGVYFFSSSAGLTGTLTLNDEGNPNALFVFQIGSTLTTAADSSVVTINSGSTPDLDIFWQVGSSATVGTDTDFEGNILAETSITMNTGATNSDGRLLAINGAVTLDANTLTTSAVPEPSSLLLLGAGLATVFVFRRRFLLHKSS